VFLVAFTTMLVAGMVIATPAAAAKPRCFGERATIVGTDRADELVGTSGRDVIVGLGGADTIEGLKGKDIICGGPGADRILGGKGLDLMFGDQGDDRLIGGKGTYNQIVPGPGDDFVDGGSNPGGDEVIYLDATGPIVGDLGVGTVSGHGEDRVVNTEWLIGGPFDDELTGSDEHGALFGADGNDTLAGLGGNDWMSGGLGDDVIDGGEGSDFIDSLFFSTYYPPFEEIAGPITVDLVTGTATGEGSDQLIGVEGSSGSASDDVMVGNADDNEFTALFDGSDTVDAGDGDDVVDGGEGADDLDGGPGVDLLGNLHAEEGMTVDLGAATDSHGDTFTGFEDVWGTFFDDTITGDAGENLLGGIDGDDVLHGLAGDDELFGDVGEDEADGGDGSDVCDAETEVDCETEPPPMRAIARGYLSRLSMR
jgi:Ca2+-binding RTX toxin-like protein